MDDQIIEFLQQSNYIENEASSEALDHAVEGWKYIISKRSLNKGRILRLHKLLMQTRDIPEELRGAWRKPVGNLTGEVSVGGKIKTTWTLVPNAMGQWIVNVNDIVLNGQNEDREFLKELVRQQHIKFETIHPFIDGNGRVGRILMNWTLIRLGFEVQIIREEDKRDYYAWFN